MSINVKQVLTIFLSAITIISLAFFLQIAFKKTEYKEYPVSHSFNTETGEVVFTVAEGCRVRRVEIKNGYFSGEDINESSRELRFSVFDIRPKNHEFIFIFCENIDGTADAGGIEYEIIRQEENEVLIQVYPNGDGIRHAGRSYHYKYTLENKADGNSLN